MKASWLILSKFENYLQHDPLFVEYFNDFLQSPAFSKKLQYDNDANIMIDKTQNRLWTISSMKKASRNGNLKKIDKATESRTLIKWSKKYRLPFFLKSKLYLEYKLCKYLIHESRQASAMPLSAIDIEERVPTTASSFMSPIYQRGAGSNTDDSIKSWPQFRNDFRAVHSRATSLPCMQLVAERSKSAGIVNSKDDFGSKSYHRPSTCGVKECDSKAEVDEGIDDELSSLQLDDNEGRASLLEFQNDDEIELNHTDNELKDISIKRQLTFQELKIDSIGSMDGMNNFKLFLEQTTGVHLLKFWLDAEHYRDHLTELENDRTKRRESAVRLVRIIQDRYKHHLTQEAQEEISKVLHNEGYSEDLFLRAQSDILRRLKFYWLPRFLVHLERLNISEEEDSVTKLRSHLVSSMSFFPSLCVVRSLPTLGHILSEEARERSFASLYEFRGNSRVKSGLMKKVTFNLPDPLPIEDPLKSALNSERDSGYPFLTSLQGSDDSDMIKPLQFWLDVDELLKQDDKNEDRLYRTYSAWNIFNRYINEADGRICRNKETSEKIRNELSSAREITKETALSLFKDLQIEAEANLRKTWEKFQAQEIEELEKASRNPTPITPHQTKRVIVGEDSKYSPSRWVKRNPGSSESERRVRLQTALSMADECNMSRMSSRALQAEKTDTVKKKKKKRRKQLLTDEHESGEDGGNTSPRKDEKPKLNDVIDNKEAMAAFKHFIQNEEGRGSFNSLSMCLDIEAYNDIHPAKKLSRQQQSSTLYRTYFDQASRRAVPLPDEIVDKVEDEMPTTPILLEAKYSVFPELEASFDKFYKKMQHVLQREISVATTATDTHRNESEGNKPDTMESFRSYHNHVNAAKTGKKKRKGTGKANPTKEDRATFLEEVQACSGRLTTEMEIFRKYLIVKEEPGAFPRLEKDLLFYIEIQKFKDLYPFMDEVALNRKVEVIIDVFLDSATPPWLQVDLNQEQAGKTIQKAQQYYSMTKRVPREQKDPYVFDEAQSAILRELLPYWAGYCKQYKDMETPPEFPLTKQEREHRKRQREKLRLTAAHEKRPNRPKTPGFGESKYELTFTVGKGFKWKEAKLDLESVMSESSATGSRKSSFLSVR